MKLFEKIKNRTLGKERQTQKDRITTINNSFVQGILPHIAITDIQLEKYKELFLVKNKIKCIYCNKNEATTIDHLFNIVKAGACSGYIDEISNMVPSCSPCNSSKSGSSYEEWIEKQKKKSKGKRRITDPDSALKRIEDFRKSFLAVSHNISDLCKEAGIEQEYQDYLKSQVEINNLMKKADEQAKKIRSTLNAHLLKSKR